MIDPRTIRIVGVLPHLEYNRYVVWSPVYLASTLPRRCAVSEYEHALRARIASLVESVQDDQLQSQELFQYVWSMMCVRRGLLRVVRELSINGAAEIVLEEVKSGRQRRISRPRGMDAELEALAVDALARILAETRLAG